MARKKAKDFESSILELEEIVSKLENGDISLEESIKVYKKGMDLAAYCTQVLDEAEQEVVYYEGSHHKNLDEGEN